MDKTEYRAVIKFLVLEGQSSKQVEERLTSVYGQSSPSSSTIKRWVKEFQRGRESLEDDPRSGRPITSTSPENIEKVHKLVIENRRISLYELEEATGISYGSIHNILHDELHMSKVCARWVPKMLSDDMKQSRVTISGAMLTRYNTNPDDFHFRVVTCDETWLYHYDPESKQESMEWKHATSPKTKKFKATRSTKKVMSTIFWDSKGVIHIDYLPHGTTMNGKYYANLLKQVRQSIKEKRRGKIRRGIMLHQDNAPVSQFILPPGQVAPRGASQPWLACPPGGNLSRDILPPTLVTFTPGGQHIPAGLSCPPGVKLNQPGYLAPHP